MVLENLHDLFALKLNVLYDVEDQIEKALTRIIGRVHNPEFKQLLQEHAARIPDEKRRIEEMCEDLNISQQPVDGKGIRGIVQDIDWILGQDISDAARDAALIGAVQYMEHYEIVAYGTAREWADQLGYHDIAERLDYAATEEHGIDEQLTDIATAIVNQQSYDEDEGGRRSSFGDRLMGAFQ